MGLFVGAVLKFFSDFWNKIGLNKQTLEKILITILKDSIGISKITCTTIKNLNCSLQN
jgi:hypothetical protein